MSNTYVDIVENGEKWGKSTSELKETKISQQGFQLDFADMVKNSIKTYSRALYS